MPGRWCRGASALNGLPPSFQFGPACSTGEGVERRERTPAGGHRGRHTREGCIGHEPSRRDIQFGGQCLSGQPQFARDREFARIMKCVDTRESSPWFGGGGVCLFREGGVELFGGGGELGGIMKWGDAGESSPWFGGGGFCLFREGGVELFGGDVCFARGRESGHEQVADIHEQVNVERGVLQPRVWQWSG